MHLIYKFVPWHYLSSSSLPSLPASSARTFAIYPPEKEQAFHWPTASHHTASEAEEAVHEKNVVPSARTFAWCCSISKLASKWLWTLLRGLNSTSCSPAVNSVWLEHITSFFPRWHTDIGPIYITYCVLQWLRVQIFVQFSLIPFLRIFGPRNKLCRFWVLVVLQKMTIH